MATTRMTRKGQITIPAEIRTSFGIKEGDTLIVYKEDRRVIVESPREIVRRTAGALARYAKHPSLSPNEERKRFEEGVAAEVAASMAAEND